MNALIELIVNVMGDVLLSTGFRSPKPKEATAMTINARTELDPAKRKAFTSWLVEETASDLGHSAGNFKSIRAAVLLYLNRAYEAELPAREIAELLKGQGRSAMVRASLTEHDEQLVLTAFDELDGRVQARHQNPGTQA